MNTRIDCFTFTNNICIDLDVDYEYFPGFPGNETDPPEDLSVEINTVTQIQDTLEIAELYLSKEDLELLEEYIKEVHQNN